MTTGPDDGLYWPPVLWPVLAHAPRDWGLTSSTHRCTKPFQQTEPMSCLHYATHSPGLYLATPDADPFLPWIFVVVGREGSASGVRCGSVLQRCRGGAESAGEIRDSGSDPIVRVTARVRSRLRSARVTLDLGADLKLHLTLVNVDWREWIRTSLTLFRPGHCQVGCHFRSSSWVLLWMGGPGGKD